jgi:hypothetical protein
VWPSLNRGTQQPTESRCRPWKGHRRCRATAAKRMGWAFNNCLVAANEATKNLKIKICCGRRWLQNDIKNTIINQNRADLTDKRWDVTSECDSIILGAIELGGGGNLGKIDHIIKLYYFSAKLQNETKSSNAAINHPIMEVRPGGFCLNHKIGATGPGKRLHHGI